MFENESKNEEMLYGAYKKLKSYYHYNKNNLFLKKKIAEFEDDDFQMRESIKNLGKSSCFYESNSKLDWKNWVLCFT